MATLQQFGLADRWRAMNLVAFAHFHNKDLIIDRKLAVVSSTNWGEDSIGQAREAGVMTESTAAARYFADVFRDRLGAGPTRGRGAGLFSRDGPVGGGLVAVHPADLV